MPVRADELHEQSSMAMHVLGDLLPFAPSLKPPSLSNVKIMFAYVPWIDQCRQMDAQTYDTVVTAHLLHSILFDELNEYLLAVVCPEVYTPHNRNTGAL